MRGQIIVRTSLVGIVVNILLAAFKAAVGLTANSIAVLLDAGLIGQTVYSAMVAMAVVCTVAAAPLARLALRGRGAGVPGAAPGERAASG